MHANPHNTQFCD